MSHPVLLDLSGLNSSEFLPVLASLIVGENSSHSTPITEEFN